jgi:mannose-6-phosphate isomerase
MRSSIDSTPHRGRIIFLPSNRVWRTYQGGRQLACFEGDRAPVDSHFPEDWIASVTRAINPGRETLLEGISQVLVGNQGPPLDFKNLIASDAEYFLGTHHVAKYGANPMLLVKLLDPSIRLHFQAHPTADFARRFLNSPSGKTEAYHILDVRPGTTPHVYLGFQRPPSPSILKRMIETQNISALKECFDPIPVHPGETFIVPGGLPHALGEGILLVEIQEPTDLVVRCEFERGGYVLPELSRFMGRGLDFCLDVFDFTPHSRAEIEQSYRCKPQREIDWSPGSWTDSLIGPAQTPCFRVKQTHLGAPVTRTDDSFYIAIVTAGACSVTGPDGEKYPLQRFEKIFVPAGLGPVTFAPLPEVEILECRPPF